MSQTSSDLVEFMDGVKHGAINMISFKGRHFKNPIILMSVRWYVAYSLSYRDIEELMAERGVKVDHSTINRWVIKYSPLLEKELSNKQKHLVGRGWRMDETYIKVKGKWCYLYRANDKKGATINFMLSKKRDQKAAKKFFRKAIGTAGTPEKVTIDESGSNNAALQSINIMLGETRQMLIRQIKYLNNIVEQDHRFIKKISGPMFGFKSYTSAYSTQMGIELHYILHKGQHTNSSNTAFFEKFYALAA